MKISLKSSILAVVSVLLIFPMMATGAKNCAPGAQATVSVSGPANVGIGNTVTYTASAYPSGGTYTWSIGNFSGSTSGKSIAVTAPVTASGSVGDQTITCDYSVNYNGCPYTGNSSKNVTVVSLESVTYNDECWAGGTISLTANPNPTGANFPAGQPTWEANMNSASVGSFNKSQGPSVVWTAPSAYGGYVDFKTTLGSNEINNQGTFVHVHMPQSPVDLLRGQSKTLTITEYPANIATYQGDNGQLVSTTIADDIVTVLNEIETSDMVAFTDRVATKIEGVLDGVPNKVLGFDVNLKKRFVNWYEDTELTKGEYYFDQQVDALKDAAANGAANQAYSHGFDSMVAQDQASKARSAVSLWAAEVYPFPGNVTDSEINESITYSWSGSATLTMNAGSVTIYDDGEVTPTYSEFLNYVYENGFSSSITDITSWSGNLNASASGANWSANGGITISNGNPMGSWIYGFTIVFSMSLQ